MSRLLECPRSRSATVLEAVATSDQPKCEHTRHGGKPELPGERTVSYRGRMSHPKLDVGRYTLVTAAVSAAGQRSNRRRLSPTGGG